MDVDAIFGSMGRFSVRFRWLMLLAWIAAAVAASVYLPSLSSVTQSDNSKFLPTSAPVERAAELATPFGTSNLIPVPLVAARTSGKLTAADAASLAAIQRNLLTDPAVKRVLDLGRSPQQQASQFVILTSQIGGDPNAAGDLINGLRAKIAQTPRPAGLQVHLAGSIAVQVDQQKANGNQGNKIELYSSLLIIVLLVLIFRSLTLALVTLAPAFISVVLSGPLVAEAAHHGIKVSPIAQFLMIVLVLGAGTDYGLFLVFRVREQLRVAHYEGGPASLRRGLAWRAFAADLAKPREPARLAIVTSVTRVGESITFSAATVIAAVLTLLLASFPYYADLGVPFAIAIGVTLLAALSLLPALLSIRLSLLGVKRTLFQGAFGKPKLLPWDIQGSGKPGVWGTIAGRIVRHPVPTLLTGLAFFGALAIGVSGYKAAGFGGTTTAPAGSDSAAGQALLSTYFPQSSANPTSLIFRFGQPVWDNPAALAKGTGELKSSSLFNSVTGPLNPLGITLTPAQYAALHAALGPAKALPPAPPPGGKIPAGAYQLYRATGNYVSADGKTVQFSVGLSAGQPGGTAALNAVPAIRAKTTEVAASMGAQDSGVFGQAPALYDISNISNRDLKKIVPIAVLAIGLLLAIVLRSLVAPTYLILSVGVSYLAALGLAAILFINLGHSGGLVFFLPFLMFIFLLALGEDYNILVMTRIREEAHKLPLREAVSRALSVTGTTVTSAGLVLAGTFLVLGFSAGSGSGAEQIRDIGFALALGILMDTFLVRTLLVPSTVVLLGRWNWWPSKINVDRPDVPAGEAEALAVQADHAR
ncbi:MAG TPA: MMPL family transporter [Streptosporangiaceae bacterium]|nr:MMPL family transporter [Streptosporangiaceae bacterium]